MGQLRGWLSAEPIEGQHALRLSLAPSMLPVLTPLLALLLAQRGWPVLVHGHSTEERRISSQAVLAALG